VSYLGWSRYPALLLQLERGRCLRGAKGLEREQRVVHARTNEHSRQEKIELIKVVRIPEWFRIDLEWSVMRFVEGGRVWRQAAHPTRCGPSGYRSAGT
jgi:hypothetical protein